MTDQALDAADFPAWTTALAWAVLGVALACAIAAAIDVMRRPQKMAVMNVVWPLAMLFGSLVWLVFYLRIARAPLRGWPARDRSVTDAGGTVAQRFALSVAVDTNHCGAGCALGDMIGELLLVIVPGLAAAVGLGTLYQAEPIAGWIVGTILAFVFGIGFQYFAIAPMRQTGVARGLLLALKADAASIAAWQIGMIGSMALIQLVWLPSWLGGHAAPSTPQFWALMQAAMIVGYACSYPVNWWLVRRGIKDAM